MKYRNGFVSNSSSSSFIIALKKIETCPHCGRKDIDILDMIGFENVYSEDTGIDALDYDETIKLFSENFKFNMKEEEYNKIIRDMEEYKNKKFKIVYFHISNHNDRLISILDNMFYSKSAIKIFSASD